MLKPGVWQHVAVVLDHRLPRAVPQRPTGELRNKRIRTMKTKMQQRPVMPASRAWVALSILVLSFCWASAAAAAARPSRGSSGPRDPVRSNETVLVVGCDFGRVRRWLKLYGWRMAGRRLRPPATAAWVRPAVLQGGDSSLKFVVPADWKPGLFAFRVLGPGGTDAHSRFSTRPTLGGGKATAARPPRPAVGCGCSASRCKSAKAAGPSCVLGCGPVTCADRGRGRRLRTAVRVAGRPGPGRI